MNKPATIETAIDRGLAYLKKHQGADGGFISQSSSSRHPFQPEYDYHTTFVPALILDALSCLDQPMALAIRNHLSDFLLQQQSSNGAYNYWAKTSQERKSQPYPDDLDDSFCVMSALLAHDPHLGDEALLVAAVKLLLATETKPGGPYRTWLVAADSEKVWLDVDVAVNANIAYFLTRASQPLPTLAVYLDQAIITKKLRSPYYPSAIPIFYYLARGYSGQHKTILISLIRQELTATKTTLDKALLFTALQRLGVRSVPVVDLLSQQQADGSWPAAAFCIDPARGGKTYYHGSAALTTAMALEALQLGCQTHPSTKSVTAQSELAQQALQLAAIDHHAMGAALQKQSLRFLRQVTGGSSGQEILGLSYLFNKSLRQPLGHNNEFLMKLSLANLYGWAAYTIYDDVIDGDGRAELLPTANSLQRLSLLGFKTAMGPAKDFVDKTFDAIDSANAWELQSCRWLVRDGKITIGRLPGFGRHLKLAERSLGHILGPMAILQKQGIAADSLAGSLVQKALSHYLIARQLNDDAHDWQEDLKRGQITLVVAAVIQDSGLKSGQHKLDQLMPQLQRQFWHHSLPAICKLMINHIRLSRRCLINSELFAYHSPLTELLNDLERSVNETLKTQSQAERFLQHYNTA